MMEKSKFSRVSLKVDALAVALPHSARFLYINIAFGSNANFWFKSNRARKGNF